MKVDRSVTLHIIIEGKELKEEFYIVDNNKWNEVILGYPGIKRLEHQEQRMIPIECRIDTGNAPPISWSRPIRSARDKVELQELIKKLEAKGIVEKSTSLWLNPTVLIRKKNGELRCCIDFRGLNDLVKLDGYRLPKITELISMLKGNEWFSIIDLKDGFYQIPIRKEDRKKTAFHDGKGIWQFRMMPQGYKNIPSTFQRAMEIVLEGLVEKICLVYIGDILIFGKDEEEHDERWLRVKERLEKYKLQINEEKTLYKRKKIQFLGFIIGEDEIRPATERVQGIQDYATPKTKKELQRFLGMLNYDRTFIKGLLEILVPLYRVLQKDEPFGWNEELQKSFEQVKEKWIGGLRLKIPDMEGNFTLETDASGRGIGAVLKQNEEAITYSA